MKVHLYLKDFKPLEAPSGGMEKAVAGLAGGIVANGDEAVILCESEADHTIPSPGGYTIRCFRNDDLAKRQKIAAGLERYVESEMTPASLVILNAIFHPSVARLAKVLRRQRVPHIIAPHDPYHPSIFLKNAHLKWPYWYLAERPMLRRASAIQVLDRRHGELLRQRGVNTPVIEVINGYREADVLPEDQLQFRTTGTAQLLFLGRIESLNKGLDLLIDAFDEVAETADVELTLQGPDAGDLNALKAQAAERKHGNRIHFRPPDFSTSPAKLTSTFDLFVLPSRFEGFSLAAMEAMLTARPVVISDIAGLAPHVRIAGCGEVVDSTVPSIRDGIRSMLARRAQWPSLGSAGRAYALEQFRWNNIAAKAMAEYRKLVAERS
jgi:glycosyltransferase involved in cell wall biosynthesis